jgi:hypothetical protein
MYGDNCERYWQQTNSAAANAVIARYAQERWLVKSATSPLHRAVYNKNIDDVVLLITGARIPTGLQDFLGRTPLFYAVFNRDRAMVCKLLSYKVDVLVRDESQMTAFDYAVASGDQVIKELLRVTTEQQKALIKREAEMKQQAELKLRQDALQRQQEAEMKQMKSDETVIKHNSTEAELQDDFVIVTMIKKSIGGGFVMVESKS